MNHRRRTPRKVRDEIESFFGIDADAVVYLTGAGAYISRKEEPEITYKRFSKKEREIIREMEREE